ncbi:hypothetical protein D3C81_1907510 [compost metagenome]
MGTMKLYSVEAYPLRIHCCVCKGLDYLSNFLFCHRLTHLAALQINSRRPYRLNLRIRLGPHWTYHAHMHQLRENYAPCFMHL